MKKILLMGIILSIVFTQSNLRSTEIIQKSESLFRGETYHGIFEMKVKTVDFDRSIKMETWAVGTEKSLIRIHSPKKEKGIGFLKVGTEMWQYLPKVRRTIKIPPSMMLASWMGSDFSNDDLARESSLLEDYNHKLLSSDNGIYSLELTPKPDAPVVWSKIIYQCDAESFVPLNEQYFDENNEIVREMVYSDVKEMNNRQIPTVMTLTTPQKPENKTQLIFHSIEYDIIIDDDIFTMKNLKKRK
jgi:outer membrane lipoprotein-sorting protein